MNRPHHLLPADGRVESEWDFYQESRQVGTNKLYLTRAGKP